MQFLQCHWMRIIPGLWMVNKPFTLHSINEERLYSVRRVGPLVLITFSRIKGVLSFHGSVQPRHDVFGHLGETVAQ